MKIFMRGLTCSIIILLLILLMTSSNEPIVQFYLKHKFTEKNGRM